MQTKGRCKCDLATRSISQEVRTLLVDLLNKANDEVAEAHNSINGKAILKGLMVEKTASKDVEASTIVALTRKRTAPQRYAEVALQDPVYYQYGRKRRKGVGRDDDSVSSVTLIHHELSEVRVHGSWTIASSHGGFVDCR